MPCAVFDGILTSFKRNAGENSDEARIMRAAEALGKGVLYIPAGVYEIASPVVITSCCSILLHKSAVLKAVKEMDFVLKYDARLGMPDVKEHEGHLVPSEDYDAEDWNLFVSGGVIDGAGLASCMLLNSFKHFTMRDMSFRNGKKYGLRLEDEGSTWTYELVAQNLYCKCTMPGLAGNAGISSRGGDSHFIDCIVVDYTIGIELLGGGSNRLTRCHVWGGPIPPKSEGGLPEMLEGSVNYRLDSGDAILTDCYADTGAVGYEVWKDTRLLGCSYFNNWAYKLDDVLVIDHKGGHLIVSDGQFRKTSPKAALYRGDNKNVVWRDNYLIGGLELPEA